MRVSRGTHVAILAERRDITMMRGLMPWTGIESLQREMDRLLDRIARVKRTEPPHDGLLTIEGEKRRAPEARYHHAERACGVFVRTLRLPAAVDAARGTMISIGEA